jgi:hypothetical protein
MLGMLIFKDGGSIFLRDHAKLEELTLLCWLVFLYRRHNSEFQPMFLVSSAHLQCKISAELIHKNRRSMKKLEFFYLYVITKDDTDLYVTKMFTRIRVSST